MRISIVFLSLFLFTASLNAQSWDTLRVMTYNLLYYGEVTSFCTTSNNPISEKDGYFEVIADHIKPDLLLVNEMGASIVYADRIINNVLNTNGVNRFQRAPIQNNSFSDLVNGVFYNKNKLSLYRQDKITQANNGSSIVRAIDICTFYYKDPLLAADKDTVFLYLVGMHLKAGGSGSDESARALAAASIMEHLVDNYAPGYFICAGDMNFGGSSEQGFQTFKSTSYGDHTFKDPLISGGWSSSSSFAYAHTQSTHTSGDCFSGGGMDDRFDIILMSGQILEDTGMVEYVQDSYTAVGNDGNHYNQSLIDGSNNSVPSSVLGALYEMSDHLPVTADVRIRMLEEDTIPNGLSERLTSPWKVGVDQDHIIVKGLRGNEDVRVSDLMGRTHSIDATLRPGFYVVTISDGVNRRAYKIFID